MLKLAKDLDEEKRVHCFLAGRIAQDPDDFNVYMFRSNGRRKSGRPAKYYLHTGLPNAILILASSDEEALELARKRLK